MIGLSAEAPLRDPRLRKLVIAPSLRVGHQWIEATARGGRPLLNVTPVTPLDLAFELAAADLASSGLEFASSRLGPMLVDGLWDALPEEGYLRRLERTPAVCTAVARSLMELRLAGVGAEQLAEGHFEVAAKAADLRTLLSAYEEALASHGLIDEAGVVRLSLVALARDGFPADVLLLVPGVLRPEGLYLDLLDAVPSESKRQFRVGASDDGSDLRLLTHLHDPAAAPDPRHDGSVKFFRGLGEANEVRAILRRCIANGRPLDQVEILCSDAEVYVPLLYGLGLSLGNDEAGRAGIPMTFADGLPAALSRPGRALAGWVRWALDGFLQPSLVRLVAEGLFRLGESRAGGDPGYVAALLRPLAVGTGGSHYLRKLDEQIDALEARVRHDREAAAENQQECGDAEEGGDAEDDGRRGARASGHDRTRLSALQELRSLIATLLELAVPLSRGDSDAALAAAERFLEEVAYAAGELDLYAREGLVAAIRETRRWATRLKAGGAFHAAGWLEALPLEVHVLGSGPRPGRLHVASLHAGGHSGRPETFVAGLDDGRFPGGVTQDPVLLDAERRSVSGRLPTASAKLSERIADFASLLTRLKGPVTLSWPCRDLRDDRDLFPSPAVLAAFRVVTGRKDGDLAALDSYAGPPVSFAPALADEALSETELWLDRLAASEAPASVRLAWVAGRHPHLARGLVARARRASGVPNDYDGFVPQAGPNLDPGRAAGPVVSASSLETAGRCPLAYFFDQGLRVAPPKEAGEDLDSWLGSAEYGSLLHEVFRRFLAELVADGEPPAFERHHFRLAAILRETVERYRREYPPPNPNAFRVRYWQLVDVARAFLVAEEQRSGPGRPVYLEASFGVRPEGPGTELDDPSPVELPLPSGRTIRLRGRIDRIDLETEVGTVGPPVFTVWDYKTGSDWRYARPGAPFWKGRVLQNVIYLSLAEAMLKRVDPAARVAAFGYLFPGGRSAGRRIEWPAEALASGQRLADAVCATIAAGAFLPTDDHEDCRYCDHRPACGDVEATAGRSRKMLDAAAGLEPGPLGPLLELRPRR